MYILTYIPVCCSVCSARLSQDPSAEPPAAFLYPVYGSISRSLSRPLCPFGENVSLGKASLNIKVLCIEPEKCMVIIKYIILHSRVSLDLTLTGCLQVFQHGICKQFPSHGKHLKNVPKKSENPVSHFLI